MKSQSHRGFIEAILSEDGRLDALIVDALQAGIMRSVEVERWGREGRTRREFLRSLLGCMEMNKTKPASSDLNRLMEIILQARAVRQALAAPYLWRAVFERIFLPLDEPVSVEPLEQQGRCNYVFRLRGGKHVYVIRYHDPIGREFLQRHEPSRAAHIYCAAAQLIGACLDPDGVVSTIFPDLETLDWQAFIVADEDHAPLQDIVADRILVQEDYSRDHFLLMNYADYGLSVEQVVELYVRPLASLHARSRSLDFTASRPGADNPLAQTYNRYRALLRFDTTSEYGRWLRGSNWIGRRVLESLLNPENQGPIWSDLLIRLSFKADELLERCHALWRESERAVKTSGSIVHLDHSPGNCFVDKRTRSHTTLLDFDYLAFIDPSYEVGISVNAIVRLFLRKEGFETPERVHALLERFFERYAHYYADAESRVGTGAVDTESLESLLTRARAFSGLIIGGALDYDYRRSLNISSDTVPLLSEEQDLVLRAICAELLHWLPA